jgi:hypothetical protein
MRTVWIKAIYRKSRCYSKNERVYKYDKNSNIFGAYMFCYIWIPHYTHEADPLYCLLKKRQKFQWMKEQSNAMQKMKKLLSSPPTLKKVDYDCGRSIILTIDASSIGIGWTIGQDDDSNNNYVVRFGVKVLNSRQQAYAEVKRKLWGVVTTMKNEKEYLIGASVVVETDCLPLLEMITSCSTPEIAMLRWIAYIKSMDLEFKHIVEKDIVVVDMLSCAIFNGKEDMVDEEEDVGSNFYSISLASKEGLCLATLLEPFLEVSYEGEWLHVGRYLSTLQRQEGWTNEEFKRI